MIQAIIQIFAAIALIAFLTNRGLAWQEENQTIALIRKISSLVFWIFGAFVVLLASPFLIKGGFRGAEMAFLFFLTYFMYTLVWGMAIRFGWVPPADRFQIREDAFETLMLYAGTPSVTAFLISVHWF